MSALVPLMTQKEAKITARTHASLAAAPLLEYRVAIIEFAQAGLNCLAP